MTRPEGDVALAFHKIRMAESRTGAYKPGSLADFKAKYSRCYAELHWHRAHDEFPGQGYGRLRRVLEFVLPRLAAAL